MCIYVYIYTYIYICIDIICRTHALTNSRVYICMLVARARERLHDVESARVEAEAAEDINDVLLMIEILPDLF